MSDNNIGPGNAVVHIKSPKAGINNSARSKILLLRIVLVLLHHPSPCRKDHLIAAFLEETLAFIFILRP